MKKYCPHLEYLVMDECHDYSDEELTSKLKNLAAILFQLEKSRTKSETQEALVLLKRWLKGVPKSLSLAFRTWIRRVKLPRHLPDVDLPEFVDLPELENMLAVTTDNWLEQSRDEGRKEGEATLFIRLLEYKFGSLSAEKQAIIYRLSETRLLECLKRSLTAKTVQEAIEESFQA